MNLSTLIISFIGGILVLSLNPVRALCVYLSVLLLQSQDLNVSIGSIDFSSSRIVALILLFRILIGFPKFLRTFHWNLLDSLVTLFFLSQVYSLMNTESFMVVLENRSGRLVETILPYFLCRFIVQTKQSLLSFLKTLVLISLPLGILGVLESSTGYNFIGTSGPQWRDGHYRAYGTFDVHIGFGLFFAAVAPICIGLWYQSVYSRLLLVIFFINSLMGLMSSWSSGPIFSMYSSISFIILYPFRKLWPLFLISSIGLYVLIDVLSNSTPIEAVTRFGLSASTWEYRIDLYKYVFQGGMENHWLYGWGLVGLDSDNDRFPWPMKDMTSLYVSELVRYGLISFFLLVLLIAYYYYCISVAFKKTYIEPDRFLIWCFCSVLFGWNISLATVNTVGQIITLYFIFIAICSNLVLCLTQQQKTTVLVKSVKRDTPLQLTRSTNDL